MKIGIIGGGAAGFMAAITAKENFPESEVILLEKTRKLLSKVKVSGGGRCNVTNAIESPAAFAKNYPRGQQQMKKALSQFSKKDTVHWFRERGLKLKAESDGRMFPVTDSSQSVIDCLTGVARRSNVVVRKNFPVRKIAAVEDGFEVSGPAEVLFFNKVLIATGGSPTMPGFSWLAALGHAIVAPVPSLFTFNMPAESIRSLQGVAVPEVKVRIVGTRLTSTGPLLITHWGMSGPAVLKLSAWGARILADLNYQFNVAISWIDLTEENVRHILQETSTQHPKKKVANVNPFGLPQRLWDFLVDKAGIPAEKTWGECGKKDFNKLNENLVNDVYKVHGKTTFKEEFVTCGGISLNEVDVKTMESKICPGLFFAGEVLDIDGITGGFNFQAAWTTGYIAGKHIGNR